MIPRSVRIVLLVGLVGAIPSLWLVLYGVDEPRIVGPVLFVPVLAATVATWLLERSERNRDRVGWLYCGWKLGDRRPIGPKEINLAAQARGLVVVIPVCSEESGYLFIALAAEYMDRSIQLSLSGSPFTYAMEQRDDRFVSDGVEHAVLLSYSEQRASLLEGEEVIVSLSRYASRQ